jgi:glycosyltransferase involved in cell wall biosynthesis
LKILFVHEVSYTKKPIFEIHEFPELLARLGHEITFFEFDEGRKFWQPSNSKLSSIVSGKVVKGTSINVERPVQLGIPGLDRVFVVLSSIRRLKKLINRNNYDVIVLYAVPTYGLQTLYFAKKSGTPVIFRALDVSHKIRSSFLSKLIKSFEKYVYTKSDVISANNPALANYCKDLSSRTSLPKVHYPPLDVKHFMNQARDNDLRNSLGIRDQDKVIAYMGSFFYFSGLLDALKVFAKHKDPFPSVKLLLIGGGELDGQLRDLAKKLGVEETVIFTGMVSYKNLPKYLSLADIAINTLEPSLVANVALPNKVLQYLASGLPVVSTQLEGLASVFPESISINWESSPASVMTTALRLAATDGDVLPDDLSISTNQLERFDPNTSVQKLEATLFELAKGDRS